MNPQYLIDAVVEQRNEAMNKLALATVEIAELKARIAELEEQDAKE